MASLIQSLLGQLSGDTLSSLGSAIGADPGTVQKGAAVAVPMLLSALAKNAGSAGGAAALDQALEKDHDGSILDGLAGRLTQGGGAGEGILKHMLGDRRSTVAAGIAQASGLDAGQSDSLLVSLAPMVMGALGKAKRSQGLDAGGVASLLSGEAGGAMSQLGGLASLLDQDGDGSVADDILGGIAKGLGGKLFGGR